MELSRVAIHGHDIAFWKGGKGPLVVLIHGMAGSSQTWRYVLPELAKSFTVVAPDLLGHGESAKPRRADYTLGAYATSIRDVLAALGDDRPATLIGQSFGGGVAMQLAYQFPERCERLVLVGSGGLGLEVNALLRALSVPGFESVLPLTVNPLVRHVARAAFALVARARKKPVPAALVETARSYASLIDADARRAFVLTLRSVIDRRGQRVSAHDRLYLAGETPTLIVWGERDPIIPVAHAHAAHAGIRGSKLELFAGAGHYPHCEDPARFVRVVTEFIRTTHPVTVSPHRWRELLTRPGAA